MLPSIPTLPRPALFRSKPATNQPRITPLNDSSTPQPPESFVPSGPPTLRSTPTEPPPRTLKRRATTSFKQLRSSRTPPRQSPFPLPPPPRPRSFPPSLPQPSRPWTLPSPPPPPLDLPLHLLRRPDQLKASPSSSVPSTQLPSWRSATTPRRKPSLSTSNLQIRLPFLLSHSFLLRSP